MDKFLASVLKRINAHSETSQNPYRTFGIFALITYPSYWLIWHEIARNGYENLELRLIAVLLAIPLIFNESWPSKLKKYLSIYWYTTLCYSLPFLFSFLLLKNHFSDSWVLNTITTIVLIVLLIDLRPLLIILPIGIFGGTSLYYLTDGTNYLPTNWSTIIVAYMSVIIFGALFAHRKQILYSERLNAMKLFAATIAHELRTPLASIKGGADGLKLYMPTLIEAYQLAQQAKLGSLKTIRQTQFEALEYALIAIEKEADASNLIINMLLTNLSTQQFQPKDFKTLSINKCIDQALARYPMTPDISKKIHWAKSTDFNFQGSEILTTHLIFNLLKNSIYYIRAACKGEIFIHVDAIKRNVFFKDTGTGISTEDLDHIFKAFYSKTRHGTGVGLAFCKSVMRAYGGSIQCDSVKGEYTEFILSFPRGEKHVN